MTAQQCTQLSQYVFKVNCSMGVVDYSAIACSSTAATEELEKFFYHDSKFKVQKINKLINYRIKGQ